MSFFGDIYAGKAANAAANYNAKIQERNAAMKEQEAKQIMSVHNDYSLPRFDRTVEEIQGATKTSYLVRGAALEGTPLEMMYEQEIQLQTDRDIMDYNAENARDQANNEAIMARADADMQRWRGKVAKKASYYAAGASLLDTAATVQGMRG